MPHAGQERGPFSGGIPGITGAPDFILRGAEGCLLGESKVSALPTSCGYTFGQFTKYMTLGAILECARETKIRRRAYHVIVVPEAKPEAFCDDYKRWRPSVDAGRLVVNAADLFPQDRKGRFRDFTTWRAFLRNTLLSERVRSRCEIDESAVARLVTSETPVVIPTYVVTWAHLMQRVRAECDAQGLRGLALAATRLEAWAYGKAEVAA